jgi:hypothetical protein
MMGVKLISTATVPHWRVWSFARNFGLGDETERRHFVWVLSLGEESREDVGLGSIQENSGQLWRSAMATTSSEGGIAG